jgi:hypothetical protein
MNKKIIIGSIIGLGILVILVVANLNSPKSEAVAGNQLQSQEQSSSELRQSADKVQVFLFHVTQRCVTCIAIGKLAGETVYEYFQPELRDGKIEFKEVNIDFYRYTPQLCCDWELHSRREGNFLQYMLTNPARLEACIRSARPQSLCLSISNIIEISL